MPNNSTLPKSFNQKYGLEIEFIRRAAKNNSISYTETHFLRQIGRRGIRIKDIKDAIIHGTLIEMNFKRGTRLVFQENSLTPNFLVVVKLKTNGGICITAFPPDNKRYKLYGNVIRRI